MDYYSNNHHQMGLMNGGGLNLPDASSSSEKALGWAHTQYMTESGYSTQAPSISSIDQFLNNEPMDSGMDTGSTYAPSTQTTVQASSEWNYKMSFPQQQTEIKQEQQATEDNDNAVANWMNYQDNKEMALKAIPELLKLIVDEDLIVVQQAAILFNQMSKNEGPRLALINTENAVQCLVDCLNTTADLETARSLVGTLYSVSSHKTAGVQAVINSKALPTLVKMLSAPMETIVSYAITTLHNVLLECGDKIKMQLRKMGAIHQMIPLLGQNTNVKFLSIVIDCLQQLTFGNQESKQIFLELGGTQMLVSLLTSQHNYQKLLLNTTRLLKVLSVCSQNKAALVNMNAMQAFSVHLQQNPHSTNPKTANDILQNVLITLRNLSALATRLNLEQLVQNLLNLLATSTDFSVNTLAAGILSNLTCHNENNKKAVLRANGVQILLKIIHSNTAAQKAQLCEPCVCSLRHITNRHSDMLLAQEQVRNINGIAIFTQLLDVTPRSWLVIKAALGVVKNFCINQVNQGQLRSNGIIEKLMRVLYDAYTEIQVRTKGTGPANSVIKVDDVNLMDIIDGCASALVMLAKDHQVQIYMKELECLIFFVQLFYSPFTVIQRSGASLLAELASSKECALVIEQQQGFQQFIQNNFCNEYGMLKSIAEVSNVNTQSNGATTILQHVHTLVQRLQDHKNQRIQQQQQQRATAFPQFNNQSSSNQEQFGGIPIGQSPIQNGNYYNPQMFGASNQINQQQFNSQFF